VVPDRALPLAQHLDAERDQAVKFLQEGWQLPVNVCQDQVLVSGHDHGRVHQHAVALGEYGQAVREERVELGVGPQQVSAPKGSTSNHDSDACHFAGKGFS
jgi:hypothetical protein